MRVIVIKPDGTVEPKMLTFPKIQEECKGPEQDYGFVQLLRLAPSVWAFVNEDGIALELPRNEKATAFCRRLGENIRINDFIKGTMVVTGPNGNSNVNQKALDVLNEMEHE